MQYWCEPALHNLNLSGIGEEKGSGRFVLRSHFVYIFPTNAWERECGLKDLAYESQQSLCRTWRPETSALVSLSEWLRFPEMYSGNRDDKHAHKNPLFVSVSVSVARFIAVGVNTSEEIVFLEFLS